jgi:transposase
MSYRELSMIEVKEVLRRTRAGHSIRKIARETGLDRKTVRRYLRAAEEEGLPAEAELTDEVLQGAVHRVQHREPPSPSEVRAQLAAHREQIAAWLEEGLKLTKVHLLLQRRGMSDASYATLRRFAQDELGHGRRKPTVRVDDPPPGEEVQVDFGVLGMIDDAETGRRRKLWALIVTLAFSRYQFVWPTFVQTTEAVIEGLEAAWRFFGGVAHRVVPDNTKAIVITAHRTAPKIQVAFAEYAQSRGFYVDPARVKRPKDKPRVENQVPFVRENFFAGEHFTSLGEARRAAAHWCAELAGTRTHGTTQRVPREQYETEERPHMLPVPTKPFDVPRWSYAKVHPDHHIQVQRALYSVPTRYIGARVRVRSDRTLVRIYFGAELIKTHPKKPPGGRSTDINDYPAEKAAYALRSVDSLIAAAEKKGAAIGGYAYELLSGPLPWTKMRQGYQLLRLCDRYGRDRVEAVCQRALDFDVIDVPRIDRMLRSAQKVESEASDQGKLHRLPARPRFARQADSFRTRDEGES